MKIDPVDFLIETLARRNGPDDGQRILMQHIYGLELSNVDKDELNTCLRIVKHKVADHG